MRSDIKAPEADLAQALGALDLVQVSIRRADTKAAGLIGFQLSMITIALGGAGTAAGVWHAGGGHRLAGIVLAVLLIAGLCASLGLLGAVIWPRLSRDGTGNLFAFPVLAALAEPPRAHPGRARDDAWRLAMQLSRTAQRKYELIRLALWSMTASTVAIVGWLCLAATSQ